MCECMCGADDLMVMTLSTGGMYDEIAGTHVLFAYYTGGAVLGLTDSISYTIETCACEMPMVMMIVLAGCSS